MRNDPQADRAIHERLVNGDPTASEELARKYLPSIQRHVSGRAHAHGVYDRDVINDAAVDAVFGYIRSPEKFDPGKSGLYGYLKRAAERDLINAVQKDRRRRRGEELHADVELSIVARNRSSEVDRIRHDSENEALSRIQGQREMADLTGTANQQDQALLRLMAEGERVTGKFAIVLGVTDLPIADQRRIVKQHKDRLKAQLKRARSKRGA
jgi:DNA-directed RNA polymerase specialized sigma24 family protein